MAQFRDKCSNSFEISKGIAVFQREFEGSLEQGEDQARQVLHLRQSFRLSETRREMERLLLIRPRETSAGLFLIRLRPPVDTEHEKFKNKE